MAAAEGKVSKNQRSGKKQVNVVQRCPKGHVLLNVKVTGIHGGGMQLTCECRGYVPIDTRAPYAQIQDRFTGKMRLPQKDKGAYVQGSR